MTEIILAGQWVDASGVKHDGGEVVKVDGQVARRLVYNGQARLAVEQEAVPTKAKPTTRRAKKVSS